MTTSSQICPDAGTWRAWLDREEQADWLPEHLAGCPGCRGVVAELRGDADLVSGLLESLRPARLPETAEVATARQRLEWRRAHAAPRPGFAAASTAQEPAPTVLRRITTPWRIAGSGIAAALGLAVVIAFTPQGSALASEFLKQFRSEDVVAVGVTPQTQGEIMRSLNALNNLGTVQLPNAAAGGTASPAQVARAVEQKSGRATSVNEAAAALHLNLTTPEVSKLPAGVDHTPTISTTPGSQISFTFNQSKARTYFQSTGHPEVSLPDKFDGAMLRITIPAAAVLHYSGAANTRNELVVVEASELVVDTQGNVSLDEMRDFLLGLPDLPRSVVTQLRGIKNWNNTLPIPVPVDQVHWDSSQINGVQGLLLNDNSGVFSAAVWHKDGQLYAVAGTYSGTQILDIANTMAVH